LVNYDTFFKEIQHLFKVRHPCCAQIIGYFAKPDIAIITKFYPYKLSDIIDSTLEPSQKKTIVLDIISGLSYLHSISITHKRLKPNNILITSDIRAEISDYVLAQIFTPEEQTAGLSNITILDDYYKPPEGDYSMAADLYALGIIIWEIFEQKKPYYHVSSSPLFTLQKIQSGSLRPIFTEKVEKHVKLKEIIEALWHQDANARLLFPLDKALNIIMKLNL